jgi:hypothetical protein
MCKWRSNNTVCKRGLLRISFRRPLSKSFDGRYLARPLIEWTRGRASHAGAGIHIVLDMRHAGDLRAGADLHVADDTGLPTHHDEVAEFRRTSNAALGHDYAMTADDDVVGNLREIVDLSALADGRVRQSTSIDGGVGAEHRPENMATSQAKALSTRRRSCAMLCKARLRLRVS